jgi:hypothetical protein
VKKARRLARANGVSRKGTLAERKDTYENQRIEPLGFRKDLVSAFNSVEGCFDFNLHFAEKSQENLLVSEVVFYQQDL